MPKRIADGQPMSRRTVYRRKKEAGLTRPRYLFNESFFDSWSDELAWLLGLIWSDGCLFGNSIEICSIDNDLLELVADLIGMPNGIRLKNNGRALRIVFTSKRTADWLRGIGLTEAKSLTANFPDIPDQYKYAFVRGLLDGDGSVIERAWRDGQQSPDVCVQWVGASPYLRDGLLNWLKQQGIKARLGISHGRVWRIVVGQQQSLRDLHRILYPHADVCCLFRKRAIYEHWLAYPRARSGRPRV